MDLVANKFGSAVEVKFTLPKELPNGSTQQTSINFCFGYKKEADECVIALHRQYRSGDLSLNVYRTKEKLEISFVDNNRIEEIYVGKFDYDEQLFDDFYKHVKIKPYIYLFVSFFNGKEDVFAFPSANPLEGLFVLRGFNCV